MCRHRALTSLPRLARSLLIPVALAGCAGERAPDTGTWVAERDTIGDTVIVRTISGSVWGEPITLAEDLAIGVLEGPEELMFGFVQAMAVDEKGGIYVFDGQVPALRYFDAEGNYVRTLGREGSGPGEYGDACLGLAVRSDGMLLMADPRNVRINVYDPDGTPADHWPVASEPFTLQAMTLDAADHIYLKILTEEPEPNKPLKTGLLHLDAAGRILDTIPDPPIAGAPRSGGFSQFEPSKQWAWSPLGYMVVGVTGEYSFELRRPGRPVLRIERVVAPVEFRREERAEWDAHNEWIRKNWGRFMAVRIPSLPARKPAYRGLGVGERGRIWVRRHTVAEKVEPSEVGASDPNRPPPITWSEPIAFDVFEPDGTCLGEVRLPPRTNAYVFRGDTVWGVRRGELDEEYVVRLVMPRSAGMTANDRSQQRPLPPFSLLDRDQNLILDLGTHLASERAGGQRGRQQPAAPRRAIDRARPGRGPDVSRGRRTARGPGPLAGRG